MAVSYRIVKCPSRTTSHCKCGNKCIPIGELHADSQWIIDVDFRTCFTNSIDIVFSTRCGSSFCSTSSLSNSWQSMKRKMLKLKNWILSSTLSINHRLVFRNLKKWKQFSCGIRGTATLVSRWMTTLLSGNFNWFICQIKLKHLEFILEIVNVLKTQLICLFWHYNKRKKTVKI